MFEFPTAVVRGAFCEWNKQINKLVYTGVLVPKGILLKTLEETNNPLMDANEIPPQTGPRQSLGRRKRYTPITVLDGINMSKLPLIPTRPQLLPEFRTIPSLSCST